MTYEFPRGDQKLFNDVLTLGGLENCAKTLGWKIRQKEVHEVLFPTFPTKIFHNFSQDT